MMGRKQILIIISFIFFCVSSRAKEVTDTLVSSMRDRVIVTYDITQYNGQVTIKFIDVKKKLGRAYQDKFRKLDEVTVVFFDRTGNYEDQIEFSGINTNAFMIPKEVKYKASKDGYFLLNDNPTLFLELKSGENTELSIPIFIAHYEGKRRYMVFSRCEDLKIILSKKKSAKMSDETSTQTVSQTVTTQEEIGGSLGEYDKEEVAKNLINSIEEGLSSFEISTSVQRNAERLNTLWPEIKDSHVKKQCEDILRRYDIAMNLKKDSELEKENLELEKKKEEEVIKIIDYAQGVLAKDDDTDYYLSDLRATSQKLQMESSTVKDEVLKEKIKQMSDKCDQKVVEIEKKKEQHNLWMIIGGVILAVVGFIGNKAFQIYNNKKEQEKILKMQDDIAKRAESEAKRRARNMAQKQTQQTQGEVKQKTNYVVNKGVGKTGKNGKGKKEISI